MMSVWRAGVLIVVMAVATGLPAQPIEARDCAEIRSQASQTLKDFEKLLNLLADSSYYQSQRDKMIRNSYNPDDPGRIFYHKEIIVEDDLTPVGNVAQNTGLNDKDVVEYLGEFDSFYSKSEENTVFFSNLHFGPIRTNEFVFLHILYNSEFRGHLKNKPEQALPRHHRVAMVRAEKRNGQWRTYLQQVEFYSPRYEFVRLHQDADCDGIIDAEDDCPQQAGTSVWGGCPPPPMPDRDLDGLVDSQDRCPLQMGPRCAAGCPLPGNGEAGPKQVLWEELLGNEGLDAAFDITKNDKGELIFAGETEIDGNGKDLYMAIFDPCRKYISNRLVVGGAQDDGARKVIQIDSGRYALAGYSESSGSGSRDAWLLLTDGTQRTGEKFFGTGRTDEAFSDLIVSDGNTLFLTGEKDGQLWLLQTTTEGTLLKEVQYQGTGTAVGTALASSPEGEIYLTGYETSGSRHQLLVLHYDAANNRLEKIYQQADARGLDIIIDREGQLVIAGAAYTRRNRDDIFAIRIDKNGQPLWPGGRTFGGIGIDVGNTILETEDGNYVLAGYSSSYAEGARREKLWINWLTPDGDCLWDEPLFWGDRFTERAYGVTQIESNAVITAGLSRSSTGTKKASKSDFWLVSIMLK